MKYSKYLFTVIILIIALSFAGCYTVVMRPNTVNQFETDDYVIEEEDYDDLLEEYEELYPVLIPHYIQLYSWSLYSYDPVLFHLYWYGYMSMNNWYRYGYYWPYELDPYYYGSQSPIWRNWYYDDVYWYNRPAKGAVNETKVKRPFNRRTIIKPKPGSDPRFIIVDNQIRVKKSRPVINDLEKRYIRKIKPNDQQRMLYTDTGKTIDVSPTGMISRRLKLTGLVNQKQTDQAKRKSGIFPGVRSNQTSSSGSSISKSGTSSSSSSSSGSYTRGSSSSSGGRRSSGGGGSRSRK